MKALTDRQLEIVGVIRASIAERGYPPTLREIGKALGIRSSNGVNEHLRLLEKKGVILRDGASRGIRLLDTPLLSKPSPAEPKWEEVELARQEKRHAAEEKVRDELQVLSLDEQRDLLTRLFVETAR